MDENWFPLNIISKDSANVGGYDLKIVGGSDEFNHTLDLLHKNKLEIVFLFGQDNIKFKKNNTPEMKAIRNKIDVIDGKLLPLMVKRSKLVEKA